MNDTNWLNVKEASLLCYELGLSRSNKSIRRWCQFQNIEAIKRPSQNGVQWYIDRASLEVKITEELEFQAQMKKSSDVGMDKVELRRTTIGHV